MYKYVLVIFGMFILQGILTYFQVQDYRKAVSHINKQGKLFVGQIKGKLKAGSIVLMAIDPDGLIVDAKSLNGITVFNRFRTSEELIGNNLFKSELWLNKIKNKQMVKAIEKGMEATKLKRQQVEVDPQEQEVDNSRM